MKTIQSNYIDISHAQIYHKSFFRFVEALAQLAQSTARQGVSAREEAPPWGIQHDLLEFGFSVLRNAGTLLIQARQMEIAVTLAQVRGLTADTLGAADARHEHPRWAKLRGEAAGLLFRLADPIAENVAFLAEHAGEPRRRLMHGAGDLDS